ncbi:MurR/RpiR family transcriptional regulator [Propioniciclava flava]|uniref:MurR/RpiR family transcriptional regulator n=1 Tax=Propioniciclava flava TaxID=2072026 RepID=A0A4Q2ELG1_9ACTN|nr:MurR/RpiR family transcriptional regulator [Propioniciclava flava]RXW33384.1 MurR/RpiR family transcriptional regulator [Propioniciclava flava]
MDILGRISTTKEHLRPAEQAVATAILADPDAASAATVASLAREAKVSQASVVRLAHSLGFSGFPDLRVSLTQELTRRTLEREQSGLSHGRLDGDDSPGDLIGKLAFHEARTIEQTGRLIDEEGLVRVADAIAEGRPTLLLGVGASALAASDLNQKLQRIGLVSVFSTDTHMQLSLAALAAPASVVIAFSFSGRTAEVHRGMELARQQGSLLVAVTGDPESPIGRAADLVLAISAREDELRVGALASRMAQLAVVDFLFVLTAQRRGRDLDALLTQTRDAVRGQRL